MHRPVTLLVGVAVAVAACSSGNDASSPATTITTPPTWTTSPPTSTASPITTQPPATTAVADLSGPHDCVPPGGGDAVIAWDQLTNPIYAEAGMVKDQSLRFIDGRWHLWFSTRTEGSGGYATSSDLVDWTTHAPGFEFASPDITRALDGRYVITQQIPDEATGPGVHKLAYRAAETPEELVAVEPVRLAPGIYDEERLIDAALAHTDDGLFLLFKRGARETLVQTPTLAHSPSGSLDGPWELIGDPELGLFENYQFLPIDGTWHLLGTRIPFHEPTLYRLDGEAADPQAWLTWTELGELEVPVEAWNNQPDGIAGLTYDIANSAHLCDARELDGYYYLTYAGATELETNDGRGHQQIGVARSTDLVTWEVP